MFKKLPALALTGLVLLQGVVTQTTTLNIFPSQPNAAVEDLQGEIQGTGADGTTFVVSGVVSGMPGTATIVKAATYVSEHLVLSTSGVKVEVNQACGLDSQNAGLCTVSVGGEDGDAGYGWMQVASATITYAPVAIDLSPNDNGDGVPGLPTGNDIGASALPGDNDNGASALPLATSIFALAPLLGFVVALW